jgi:thiamine pyrophosphate-dependent acetolactate synthase large subunit-like protein
VFQTADMLRIFNAHRGDAIVVPGRGGPHWNKISTRPGRDVPLGDPAMGGHAGFALGLALARPADRVVLFDSEGDLLMSLGILPTVAELAPANFYHFMLDNECYATTGGQPVPNAKNVAYDVIARGCGYPRAFAFDKLEDFEASLPSILAQPGPVFAALKVVAEVENVPIGQRARWQTRTRDRVLADLRAELGVAR